MEDSEKVPLKDSLEIDQQVAAAYQVELSERRILENVVLSEYDHFPYIVTNKVLISFPCEVTGKPGHADIFNDVVAVYATACNADGIRVEVGRKNFDVSPDIQLLHSLHEKDSN